MQQYVYPVVFIKEENDSYAAFCPDLNLSSDGNTIEEAYLFIQDFITVYCSYAKKMEDELVLPSKFENVAQANKNKLVMLVDAFV